MRAMRADFGVELSVEHDIGALEHQRIVLVVLPPMQMLRIQAHINKVCAARRGTDRHAASDLQRESHDRHAIRAVDGQRALQQRVQQRAIRAVLQHDSLRSHTHTRAR